MFNESQVELLEKYEDYLREKGYAESSIAIYSRRIKNFFKNGYSVDDLIGKLIDLIGMYSNGGSKFDPKDHANTSNALKRLADYLEVDRSGLSTELNRLKKDGVIDFKGKVFTIL